MYQEDDRLIYLVSEFFLSPLVNDDRSPLSDAEEEMLDAFLAQNGHHFTPVYNEYGDPEMYFTRCEVCNELAMCYEVTPC